MKNDDQIIEWAERLQALAQAGLYYGEGVFDRQRYSEIREIAVEMMSERMDLPKEKVRDFFCTDVGYQTPKLDTRAVVIKDDQILLVKESSGKWAIPGGWCEFNLTAAENTIKEAREEAGVEIRIIRPILIHDRDRHCSIPYPFHVTKIFFLCEETGFRFHENIETSEARYFAEDELPEIDEMKVSEEQVHMCFQASRDPHWITDFDR